MVELLSCSVIGLFVIGFGVMNYLLFISSLKSAFLKSHRLLFVLNLLSVLLVASALSRLQHLFRGCTRSPRTNASPHSSARRRDLRFSGETSHRIHSSGCKNASGWIRGNTRLSSTRYRNDLLCCNTTHPPAPRIPVLSLREVRQREPDAAFFFRQGII